MSNYTIQYSDTSKGTIVITTGTVDTTTGLKLIGRNYPNFGQPIAENFLHLLENFAGPNLPTSPVDGQLWYDTQDPANKQVKVYDGASWVPSGSVWKGVADPYSLGSKNGDIWVDTERQLLKIQTDAGWVLVGPTFSNSNRTGSYPDSIIDKNGDSHDVIFMYLNDIAIEIIAKEAFTPLTLIDGFTNLVPGINISSKVFDGSITKVAGIAESASALRQTSPSVEVVSANNFVRNDINQSIDGVLRINNNSGLQIGLTTATFTLQRQGRDAVFSNYTDKGKFSFKTFNNAVPTILMTIDGDSKKIGIGTDGVNDNINPAATLDVLGTLKVSSTVNFVSTSTSSAFNVSGKALMSGIETSRTLTVNSTTFLKGIVTIGDSSSYLTIPSGILSATTGTIDIGSSSKPFKGVYAITFGAGGTSNTATFYGTLVGSASKLTNPTTFSIGGDVRTTSALIFDGSTATSGTGYNRTFATELTTSAIRGKPYAYTYTGADEMLFYSTTATSLARATKEDFLSDLYGSLVPTGGIIPYAGATLPAGWAWCDGHAYNQTGPGYIGLFGVIGITYGYSAGATIDFRVPNLNNTNTNSVTQENKGPYSLYAGTGTNISAWPLGIKYIIKL